MALMVEDIMTAMEAFAPTYLAEPWDNVGLLVGDPKWEVKKVLVALDATLEVIEEAVLEKVDMLVTHHPILFAKTGKIVANQTDGLKVMRLIENRIALYSAHTNLDQAQGGVEDTLAMKLGLQGIEIIEEKNVRDGIRLGYGRIGVLDESMSLEQYAKVVRQRLGLEGIYVTGDSKRLIQTVAVACGSGSDQLQRAFAAGADVLVTGDVKYHTAVDAKDLGIAMMDATHFGTEHLVMDLMMDILKRCFEDLNMIKSKVVTDPLQILK